MIDADRVREATDTVLRRPEYGDLVDTPWRRGWDELRAFVADLLADLFLSPTAGTLGRIVAYGVVLLVLGLLVTTLLGLRRRAVADVVVDVTTDVAVADLLAEADRLRDRGALEAAVRTRYGALLRALVEREVLAGRPGTTVGEVDAAVARRLPAAADAVHLAGRSLAEVVYGHRAPTLTDDAEVAAAVQQVASAPVPVVVP